MSSAKTASFCTGAGVAALNGGDRQAPRPMDLRHVLGVKVPGLGGGEFGEVESDEIGADGLVAALPEGAVEGSIMGQMRSISGNAGFRRVCPASSDKANLSMVS